MKGMKKTLQQEDLGEISDDIKSELALKKLKYFLKREEENVKDTNKVSLARVFFNTVKSKFLVILALSSTSFILEFVANGIVLPKLIEFLESPEEPTVTGIKYTLLLVSFYLTKQMCSLLSMFLACRLGTYAKAAVMGLIYEKTIKLKTIGNKSVGELVNLCANDSTRIFECSQFLINLLILPFVIVLNSGYLVYFFGPTSLVGCGIVLIYLPFQILLGRIFTKLRQRTIHYTDKRVKMISEAMTSIKLIKMYAWEKSFAKVIYALRRSERFAIQRMAFVQGFTFSLGYIITIIAPVATFITHVYAGYELNIPKAFTLLALFNNSLYYIITGPMGMRGLAETLVSFGRIKDLIYMDEHVPILNVSDDSENAVEITSANLSWNKVATQDSASDNVSKNEVIKPESEIKVDPGKIEVTFKPGEDNNGQLIVDNDFNDCSDVLVPTLFNIDLTVKKKSLIGICGSVGSGKSSLIQAILGEMKLTDGSVAITDSIAYVPQQAFIVNSTVRNNILFDKEYEENFYKDVCTACALDDDLKLLASGDLTEIGERGINLSGGQKQRISLARAVYAEKELYLLDDPLSAVDSHVGKHIFEKCIKLALRKRTVIFVTHQLQYLKDCDYVLYMKGGCFTERGTYSELINNNKDFAHDIQKFQEEHQKEKKQTEEERQSNFLSVQKYVHDAISSTSISRSHAELSLAESMLDMGITLDDSIEITDYDKEKKIIDEGKLIQKEDKVDGAVSFGTYKAFYKYAGGFFPIAALFSFILGTVLLSMSCEYWLSQWLQLKDNLQSHNATVGNVSRLITEELDTDYYMKIYVLLTISVLLITVTSTFTTVFVLLRASTYLHNAVFKNVLASPMEFFDTTPIGRIVNRLAKDVDDIDNYLPWMAENFVRNFARVIGSLILVAIIIPWFLIAMVPVAFLFLLLNIVYRKVIRAIKRLDNVSRSPIYSHVAQTIQGLLSIRAYQREKSFLNTYHNLANSNHVALYLYHASARWFSIYTDLFCLVVLFATCLSAVLLKDHGLQPAFAALCITYSLRVIGLFQFAFRLGAEVEAKFTSVERLNHYVKTLKSEGEFETKDPKILENWPLNGSVEFKNVSFRYRDGLPLVLKNISLNIKNEEKIGIVGRTGAGKSSIGVVLYRIVNIEEGSIEIAGVDTKSLGLTDLRSNLSIIPQDPILFIGSIRYNLDPFSQYSDVELWDVLSRAHIIDMVSDLPEKLESMVLENGSNFSVGERQLICMARALLRNSKILMLDEATAAIDSKTDSKIQETIKESFAHCTVLTVAHRLNTIMHCDRILVMEDGQVAEFDAPSTLLDNPNSLFSKMVKAASTRVKH